MNVWTTMGRLGRRSYTWIDEMISVHIGVNILAHVQPLLGSKESSSEPAGPFVEAVGAREARTSPSKRDKSFADKEA